MAVLNKEREVVAQSQRTRYAGHVEELTRAKSRFDAGDLPSVLSTTERLLARDPDHLGALEVRVRAEWRLGDFQAVLRTLNRLALINPYEPGYFLMQGDSLRMLGRLADARSAYERCAAFGASAVQEEALSNLAEIDAELGPVGKFAAVPIAGVTEFLPSTLDSLDALFFAERAKAEDRPTWSATARPS